MNFFFEIQKTLEEHYGAHTGLDIRDFVRATPALKEKGTLLVEQVKDSPDLNIALLLDRDIFEAFSGKEKAPKPRELSVGFEEISHFVYLCFNHNRGRNITALEMEMQSEVDRVLLAFEPKLGVADSQKHFLLNELMENSYTQSNYEEARLAASRFVRQLSGGKPEAWSAKERAQLRQFFHSDLSEKLRLSKTG